jgi:hypothetical protein
MKRKEIEKKKEELKVILADENAGRRLEKLQKLAKEVGASVIRMGLPPIIPGEGTPVTRNIITEDDIVHNIQVALQTETMIDMCKTAARNFWITLVAMLIAVFAMLAAWAGVVVNWWSGC